ncbi:MAG TPA: DEAD/DEAH box helicase [Spirochaetota bacterium]|nr:DEAD/DEAH box helicase [Spirochaetota bacterium]HPF05809.1 DEAD/DEAH box helicase [Spirochaetota bacterium]HPJ42930.1 DEAD/DEAH box helicase [Spirochaetota bacterium]HPR37496.1 DEAD/DEAH box helicase [Spirochaetota bacterium]HRX47278.1 DEAD/DEAH box helicase [Spirochaetota bacterium]
MKFSELNLDEKILKGIEKAGFVNCTDVQAETLTHSLSGKDVLVQSQTGTGKTAAFLVTVYHILLTREDYKNRKVLILAPTRELVIQIEKEAKMLGAFLDLKIGSFYGGVGYNQQEAALREGVNIMIGTPGRLMDFAGSGKIKFSDVGMLVIDEADRMFDMGFFPDIRKIMKRMAPPSQRISMLFSATLSMRVKNLAWEYMNEPAEVNMSGEQITVDKIRQALFHVGSQDKMRLLLGLLKQHNPQNVLIFTNTKQGAVRVAACLAGNGYECDYIIGDLPQKKRIKIIDNIKAGKLRYLVATDVAARGLHIDDLNMVINYDIPEDYENYVHRIGRTARAGKSGLAVTLACEKFVYGLEAIEAYIKMKIPVEWAGDELYVEDVSTDEFVRSFMRTSRDTRESTERKDKGDRKPKGKKPVHEKKPVQERREKAAEARPETGKKKPAARPEKTAQPQKERKTAAAASGQKAKSSIKDSGRKEAAARKPVKEVKRPSRKASPDKRMNYYKEKYGEDFVVNREIKSVSAPKEKKSIIEKIKSLFKGK